VVAETAGSPWHLFV